MNVYRGISLYRLKKILLVLLNKGEVIEVSCRIFSTTKYLEKILKKC